MKGFLANHLSFLRDVLRQIGRHDDLGMSAEIAFVMMFAFLQALLLTVAILTLLGVQEDVFNTIVRFLGDFLPYELSVVIRRHIAEIARSKTGGILVISLIGTVWTMTTLMFTLKKNFERTYHIKETRSFWRVRLIVFNIALAATFLMTISLVLLLFGLQIARYVESTLGYQHLLATLIRMFRIPVAFVAVSIVASLLYWAMINVQEKLTEVLPGAMFFSVLWFLSTYGFSQYMKNFPYYNAIYGTLGAFVVLMGWMYLTSLSLLIGGEVNAEIYRRHINRKLVA
jgi:membrane protein